MSRKPSESGKIVLIVEDDPEDVELTRLALADILKPYEVVVARDGVEALDYLLGKGAYLGRDTRVKPKLILLDLSMPRKDGYDFLRELREKHGAKFADVKIAVLSSSYDAQKNSSLCNLGVDRFLLKPISRAQSEAVVLGVKTLLPCEN